MNNIRELYFSWIVQQIGDDNKCGDYSNLLSHLFDTEFIFTNPMDGNRYEDGIELRYKFGYHNNISDDIISAELDIFPCSVLEMMVALAIRMEDFMDDPDIGNRIPTWFWNMVDCLELSKSYDRRYDMDYVDRRLEIFMNREYSYDGAGGLFQIINPPADLRTREIWMQTMWYLNEH